MSREKVELPFRAAFKDAILSGRKTVTSRTKKYGEADDILTTPFGDVLLRVVVKARLRAVEQLWEQEGCDSQEDFIRVWRSLHRGSYDPERIVWVHYFELAR